MSQFITAATYQILIPSATPVVFDTNSGVYAHLSLDGSASPSIERYYRANRNTDGGTDGGYRLRERRMAWKLFVSDSSESGLEDSVYALLNYIKPNEEPLTLKVERADGALRQIEFYVDGPVDIQQSRQIGYSQEITIPIYCPNPIWYDPELHQMAPGSYGATTANAQTDYAGSWLERPVIWIDEEFVDLVIEINPQSTVAPGGLVSGSIDFTGYTTPAGDRVIIDLLSKTATLDSDGSDVSGEIANDDWLSASMIPAKRVASVANGNTMYLYYTSRSSGVVTVRYYDRYINL